VAGDEQAEISGLAETIKVKRSEGWSYYEQALLCRTNAQAAAIARGLEDRGIPVYYLGNLFEREEVQDMLALLSLAGEGDGPALVRVARIPEHAMDPQAVQLILDHAQMTGQPLAGVLANAADIDGLSPGGVQAALGLARVLIPMVSTTDAWDFLARYLFEHGSYARELLYPSTVTRHQRLLALGQLLALAHGFRERPLFGSDEDGKRAFLGYVRQLVASRDPRIYQPLASEHVDAVRILTIHASKGLEFPVVYIPNLAEGRFPTHKRRQLAPTPPGLAGMTDEDELAEEACLFFVGLSRARDELVLSRSERYGEQSYEPSSLLDMAQGFFSTSPPIEVRWEYRMGTATDTGPHPPTSSPNSGRGGDAAPRP
jgi:superfamily I DNA/RNA helicase